MFGYSARNAIRRIISSGRTGRGNCSLHNHCVELFAKMLHLFISQQLASLLPPIHLGGSFISQLAKFLDHYKLRLCLENVFSLKTKLEDSQLASQLASSFLSVIKGLEYIFSSSEVLNRLFGAAEQVSFADRKEVKFDVIQWRQDFIPYFIMNWQIEHAFKKAILHRMVEGAGWGSSIVIAIPSYSYMVSYFQCSVKKQGKNLYNQGWSMMLYVAQ